MQGLMQVARRLTIRQAVALAAVAVAGAGVILSAAAGRVEWTMVLTGAMVAGVFAAVLQLRRRLNHAVATLGAEARRSRQTLLTELRGLGEQAGRLAEENQRLETGQRRLLAAVETERLAADDRQQELLTAVRRVRQRTVQAQREQTREVEALLQLYRDLRPRAPMPPSGAWAMNAVSLLQLLALLDRTRPNLVLELGSGTSTVWASYVLERTGGRMVSVEHQADFVTRATTTLELHGLQKVTDVRHAPLMWCPTPAEGHQWYSPDVFSDISGVDLLIVDGPPGSTGPHARYPALPMLVESLAPSATVVLDDADRPEETEIVKRWLREVPGLTLEPDPGRQAVFSYRRP